MGLAFTVKGLQTSIVLKDKQISGLTAAVDQQKSEINEAHVQENLAIENNKNSQADLKVEKEKISKLQNKGKVQKALLWISCPLVVIESGWIFISTRLKN